MTSYFEVDLGLNKRQRPGCGELFIVVVCGGMRHLVPAVRGHTGGETMAITDGTGKSWKGMLGVRENLHREYG